MSQSQSIHRFKKWMRFKSNPALFFHLSKFRNNAYFDHQSKAIPYFSRQYNVLYGTVYLVFERGTRIYTYPLVLKSKSS